jgi:hypothetical protein
MTAEFNVWLLLVGLVVGGGLTWLVIGELRRSDADVGRGERHLEAGWIADQLAETPEAVTDEQADAVLRLHERYLAISLPPEPSLGEAMDTGPDETDIEAPTAVSETPPTVGEPAIPVSEPRRPRRSGQTG